MLGGEPHRLVAEFLGAHGQVTPQAGGVNATQRNPELHSADVTQPRASAEVLLSVSESVILRGRRSSVWAYDGEQAEGPLRPGSRTRPDPGGRRVDLPGDAAAPRIGAAGGDRVRNRHLGRLDRTVGSRFAASIVYAILAVDRRLRWFTTGQPPTARDRQFVEGLLRNQSALLTVIWLISGTVMFVINRDGGAVAAWLIGMAVLFGLTTSTGAALLLIQRPMRPITAASWGSTPGRDTAPGVLPPRLLLMWLMTSALPSIGIAVVVLMRSTGWIIQKNASIEIPVIVLSVISVLVGLRGMAIVALSISDPVHDVVAAMARVERGQIATRVDVYERSEIGRLQSGFNRMVAGLAERDRLRDLFGRHVGTDVALRAVSDADSLTGEVREAAVLFVDLVGSTQLAQSRSPAEVAHVLNEFFPDRRRRRRRAPRADQQVSG